MPILTYQIYTKLFQICTRFQIYTNLIPVRCMNTSTIELYSVFPLFILLLHILNLCMLQAELYVVKTISFILLGLSKKMRETEQVYTLVFIFACGF
jgi:hypothetical protein